MARQAGTYADPIALDDDDDDDDYDQTSSSQSPSNSRGASLQESGAEKPMQPCEVMRTGEKIDAPRKRAFTLSPIVTGINASNPDQGLSLDLSNGRQAHRLTQSSHTQDLHRSDNVPGNTLETRDGVLEAGCVSQNYTQETRRGFSSRAQASLNKVEFVKEQTKADFEEKLRSVQASMKLQHASNVQGLLREAVSFRRAAEHHEPTISPFANTNSLSVLGSAPTPKSGTNALPVLRISQIHTKQSKALLATVCLDHIKPKIHSVPAYQFYTHITRNVHRPDDDQLYFEPYLGDTDSVMERFLQDFRNSFNYIEDSMATRDAERAMRANNHLDEMLRSVSLTRQHLYKSVLKQVIPNDDDNSTFSCKHKEALQKALDTDLIGSSPSLPILFRETFNKVFELELYTVLLEHDSNLNSLMNSSTCSNSLIHGNSTSVNENISTYTDLMCMICHTSICLAHKQCDEEDMCFALQTRSYEDSVKQLDNILARKTVKPVYQGGEYCSDECFMKDNRTDENIAVWKHEDYTLLETILSGMPTEPRAACLISMVMPRHPCWAVQRQISKIPEPPLRSVPMVMTKKLKWYNPLKKTLSRNWKFQTNTNLHHKRHPVKGCQHTGSCDDDNPHCSCGSDSVLCEKLCSCTNCPRKFTGCACSGEGKVCSGKHCICVQLERECDPDLCGSCGAIERADPQCQREISFFETGCQNVQLQIADKIARKTIIGRTKIINRDKKAKGSPYNFFGLFAGEDIPEGAFIDEYVGEVMSMDESNRWIGLFEKLNKSYIFNLNKCEVIDSLRMGNNTRFINHAKFSDTNMGAQIVLVNLVHRIKFIAIKRIKAGSELLFHYGDDFFGDATDETKETPREGRESTIKPSRKRDRTSAYIEEEDASDDPDYMDEDEDEDEYEYEIPDEQQDEAMEFEIERNMRRTRSGRLRAQH